MKKIQYRPRVGFRISRTEAQLHGEAINNLTSRLHRPITVADYARFCAKPSSPTHDSWKRKREEFVRGAGREAAAYFMRGIVLVSVPAEMNTTPRAINFVLHDNIGLGFTHKESKQADVVAMLADEFREGIRGRAMWFANVAGVERMLKEADGALEEFRQQTKKPPEGIRLAARAAKRGG